MAPMAQQIADMVEMLPDDEQALAYEFIKRMVLAWDPDFSKATPGERARMEKAEREFQKGEYVTASEIDWDAE